MSKCISGSASLIEQQHLNNPVGERKLMIQKQPTTLTMTKKQANNNNNN